MEEYYLIFNKLKIPFNNLFKMNENLSKNNACVNEYKNFLLSLKQSKTIKIFKNYEKKDTNIFNFEIEERKNKQALYTQNYKSKLKTYKNI